MIDDLVVDLAIGSSRHWIINGSIASLIASIVPLMIRCFNDPMAQSILKSSIID
jgi:hypothetical protein